MKYTQYLISILFLYSCLGGGGGGSNTTNDSSPVQPTPSGPSYETLKRNYEGNYEYQRQWGLGLINASSAYARGSTGDGVTIGITDSGLDTSHKEIDPERILSGSYLEYDSYKPNTRQKRHGTMVTSIAAGKLSSNDDTPMHGVAFNADVFFVAIQLAEPDDTYDPIDLGDDSSDNDGGSSGPDLSGTDNFFENLFQVFTSRNINIVNNSYGFSGNIADYSQSQIRTNFSKTLAAIAQSNTPNADKTIFVWAAGNAGGYADSDLLDNDGNIKCDQSQDSSGINFCSPEVFPGMTYFIDEIQGHSVAVVSVDDNGVISSFSNRCGLAKDFCIAAPGGAVLGAYPTSDDDYGIYDDTYDCVLDNSCYAQITGTSFASPFVAGALAVLFQHFEGQLGSTEIVTRLFATANDDGIYSNAEIYGHGLIDLEAATNPLGQLSVNVNGNLFGETIPLSVTGLNLYNPILNGAILASLSQKSIIALDELNSPFRIPMISLLAASRLIPQKIDKLAGFSSPRQKIINSYGLELQLIEYAPLKGLDNFNSNYLQSFSDISKSFHLIDTNDGKLLTIGRNDANRYLANNFNNRENYFKNPYLEFSRHGILLSETNDFSEGRFSWVLSLGNPEISIEEIFHEHSSNLNLTFLLEFNNFLPDIQIGWLSEKDRLFGMNASGAMNFSENSNNLYFGIHDSYNFKKIGLNFTAFKGYLQDEDYKNSLIKSANSIETSFYDLGITMKEALWGFDVELNFTKNLYVSNGEIRFNLPVYRDRYYNLYSEDLSIPLKTSNPEMHSKIRLKKEINKKSFYLDLEKISNPYNGSFLTDYTNIGIGYNIRF